MGEATWIEAGMPLCGAPARQRNGEPCLQPAGWGTSHAGYGRCRFHGGATRSGEVHAERAKWADRASYASSRDVDPAEALTEELARTAGAVDYLRDRIAEADGEPEPALLHQYRDERDRLARVARTCIEAGVLERRTALAEVQGAAIAGLIGHVLHELALSPDQLARAHVLVHRGLLELGEP